MGNKTGKGGAKIGDNSPNTGKGRKVPAEQVKQQVNTRKRNRAAAALRKAARSTGGTINAGTGSMWGEVSDDAILNMAANQGRNNRKR